MSIDHTPNHGGFRIDPDTQRRIEAHARAAHITPAELVRKAFEQYEATHYQTFKCSLQSARPAPACRWQTDKN